MDFSWKIVIDAGLISFALVIATFLRSKVRFLQKFLVPNALTAGFLLLPLYNFLMPAIGYGTNRLGDLVYHLLNLSFISMS
ncbi:MAG TPA: sodium:glutamate symporter, partial [Rectinema sp.]|nr:sodium:glutamate symporter [Rectinema sp.]